MNRSTRETKLKVSELLGKPAVLEKEKKKEWPVLLEYIIQARIASLEIISLYPKGQICPDNQNPKAEK